MWDNRLHSRHWKYNGTLELHTTKDGFDAFSSAFFCRTRSVCSLADTASAAIREGSNVRKYVTKPTILAPNNLKGAWRSSPWRMVSARKHHCPGLVLSITRQWTSPRTQIETISSLPLSFEIPLYVIFSHNVLARSFISTSLSPTNLTSFLFLFPFALPFSYTFISISNIHAASSSLKKRPQKPFRPHINLKNTFKLGALG